MCVCSQFNTKTECDWYVFFIPCPPLCSLVSSLVSWALYFVFVFCFLLLLLYFFRLLSSSPINSFLLLYLLIFLLKKKNFTTWILLFLSSILVRLSILLCNLRREIFVCIQYNINILVYDDDDGFLFCFSYLKAHSG